MVDVTSDPALMLNFKCEATEVTTIDLTGTEAMIICPPPQGNSALDAEEDMNASTAVPDHSSHSQGVFDESFSSIAPSLTGFTVTPAAPSTSALQSIPTASLIINKKTFSPKSINKVKSLISEECRVQTLITVGTEEAATCFDAITYENKESYDGDVSKVDEEDAEVVPDKTDNA